MPLKADKAGLQVELLQQRVRDRPVGRAPVRTEVAADRVVDFFKGEVIAPWDKENRSYATNAEIVGDKLLVEVRDLDDKGDGLRLVKVPDAVTKRFRVR